MVVRLAGWLDSVCEGSHDLIDFCHMLDAPALPGGLFLQYTNCHIASQNIVEQLASAHVLSHPF